MRAACGAAPAAGCIRVREAAASAVWPPGAAVFPIFFNRLLHYTIFFLRADSNAHRMSSSVGRGPCTTSLRQLVKPFAASSARGVGLPDEKKIFSENPPDKSTVEFFHGKVSGNQSIAIEFQKLKVRSMPCRIEQNIVNCRLSKSGNVYIELISKCLTRVTCLRLLSQLPSTYSSRLVPFSSEPVLQVHCRSRSLRGKPASPGGQPVFG